MFACTRALRLSALALTLLVVGAASSPAQPLPLEHQAYGVRWQAQPNPACSGQEVSILFDACRCNVQLFDAGTKPDDAESAFRIISLERATNNTRITWTTVLGKSYRVQTNAPINGSLSTNFFDVSPLIAAPNDGNESTTNFVHVGAFTNAPAGYYRIRLGP